MYSKTPAILRKTLAKIKANRVLFMGGFTPVQSLINKLSLALLPSEDPSRPTSEPVYFRSGDIIKANELVTIAKNLQEDTDILNLWMDTTESILEQEYVKREARRQSLERRIRQLKTKADSLSRYSNAGNSQGIGGTSTVVDFTDLSLIDFSRITADIIPAGGAAANGEATLSRDPFTSKALDTSLFKVISVETPPLTRTIGRIENILNSNSTQPYQIVLPGKADGNVVITLQINNTNIPLDINGIEIDGINQCSVLVETGDIESNWDVVSKGILAPLGKTVLRFSTQKALYLRLTLNNPQKTAQDNGDTIGIRTIRVFNATYINNAVVLTNALLSSAAPLQGVKVNVQASVPLNTSVDVDVSFTGPDSEYLKSEQISTSEKGIEFDVWVPNITREQIFHTQAFPPFDNSRFWTLTSNTNTVVPWDSSLYVGVNQWYVETKVTNNDVLDYPYKTPSLDNWKDNPEVEYNSGVIFPTNLYNPISGDVSVINFTQTASGFSVINGFMFSNNWNYGLEETTKSQVLMAYDGIHTYMKPGNEYKLTTWVHCQQETALRLNAMVPGSAYAGGTICFSYNINGKSILSVGDSQVEGLAGWLGFQANSSFIAGWNKLEILLYRPSGNNEINPSKLSCLRFSFDPLSTEANTIYSITQVQFKQNSLTRVSEFALKILRPPGDRSVWAWKEGLTVPYRILSSSWGYDTTSIVFDGISTGVGANFFSDTRLGTASDSPSCWVKVYLQGNGTLPPTIQNIRIDAL